MKLDGTYLCVYLRGDFLIRTYFRAFRELTQNREI